MTKRVNTVTCDGSHLAWVDELRYLGIFIVRARFQMVTGIR